MQRARRRQALMSLAATAALAGLVPAAEALPGGGWAGAAPHLQVTGSGGYVDGTSYGTWQGVRSDEGRGDGVQNSSYHRHIKDDVGGGDDGTYVKNSWYANKTDCYISAFNSTGGAIGCSAGWWSDGNTQTGSTKSISFQYWEAWHGLDPNANSIRDQIRTCENINLWPDFCSSAYFLRGADE